MPYADASVGRRVPETSSIAPTITTIVITVPRSGSTSTSRQNTPTSSPIGRPSSFSVCGAGLRERYAAHQMTSASYDQFENFEQRGEAFRRLVEELA